MTRAVDGPEVERFLGDRLRGAQLDSIRVYSLELQINFMAKSKPRGSLKSIWLSAMGNVSVSNETEHDLCQEQSRSSVVSKLYELIGKDISSVGVDRFGALALHFGDKILSIWAYDDDNFEEVWSITPDSPEPYIDRDWFVTLTDQGDLVARID